MNIKVSIMAIYACWKTAICCNFRKIALFFAKNSNFLFSSSFRFHLYWPLLSCSIFTCELSKMVQVHVHGRNYWGMGALPGIWLWQVQLTFQATSQGCIDNKRSVITRQKLYIWDAPLYIFRIYEPIIKLKN